MGILSGRASQTCRAAGGLQAAAENSLSCIRTSELFLLPASGFQFQGGFNDLQTPPRPQFPTSHSPQARVGQTVDAPASAVPARPITRQDVAARSAAARRPPTYAFQRFLQQAATPPRTMEPRTARGGRKPAAATTGNTSLQSTCFVKKLFTMVAVEDASILSFSHGEWSCPSEFVRRGGVVGIRRRKGLGVCQGSGLWLRLRVG